MAETAAEPAHPLDPLTAREISQVAAAVRRDHATGPQWRFAVIELTEPGKDELAAFAAGQPVPRSAMAVCWHRADGHAYRARVALPGIGAGGPAAPAAGPAVAEVTVWEHLPSQQPNLTSDEWHECDEMLRAHPRLRAGLARRGITDTSRVLTDVWAYGADLVPPAYRGRRVGWADVWYRASPDGNPYAHHVTGLHPVVDLNRMELLDLEDSAAADGLDGLPAVTGEYLPWLLGTPLREVKPLHVSQPAGRPTSGTAACCAGRTGSCGSGSRPVRDWSCTP